MSIKISGKTLTVLISSLVCAHLQTSLQALKMPTLDQETLILPATSSSYTPPTLSPTQSAPLLRETPMQRLNRLREAPPLPTPSLPIATAGGALALARKDTSSETSLQRMRRLLKAQAPIGTMAGNFTHKLGEAAEKTRNLSNKGIMAGAYDLYKDLMDKYVYGAVKNQIDQQQEELLKQSGMQGTEQGKALERSLAASKAGIMTWVTRVIDNRIKDTFYFTHYKVLMPLLARTYNVPLDALSYANYQLRLIENPPSLLISKIMKEKKNGLLKDEPTNKHDATLTKFKNDLVAHYLSYYQPALKLLSISSERLEEQRNDDIEAVVTLFDKTLIPAFNKILRGESEEIFNQKELKKTPPSEANLRTLPNAKQLFKDAQKQISELISSAELNSYRAPTTRQIPNVDEDFTYRVQSALSKSQQLVMDTFYPEHQGADRFKSYLTEVKNILLPEILKAHFPTWTIPGSKITPAKATKEQLVEALEKFDKEYIQHYIAQGEKAYKTAQRMYQAYIAAVSLVEAIAITIEVLEDKTAKNYYENLFNAIDKYLTSFENLVEALGYTSVDLAFDNRLLNALQAPLSLIPQFLRPAVEQLSIPSVSKQLKDQGTLDKKALGVLKYCAGQYRRFYSYFLKLFVKAVDETGETIYKLKTEQIIPITIEILKPKVTDYIKGRIKSYFVKSMGPAGESWADTFWLMGTKIIEEEAAEKEKLARDFKEAREKYIAKIRASKSPTAPQQVPQSQAE